ncbi:hypothetical protein KC867_03545 [Candidatus Saccharibacteria bacterium]|nr:hypothetical protein [Candidatus Saccharibacteria bacterium]
MSAVDLVKPQTMSDNDELFVCFAEQVGIHLAQISSMAEAELAQADIATISRSTIKLIEGFVMSLELQAKSEIEFEAVSIGSMLCDIAHFAEPYAKLHDFGMSVDASSQVGLVIGHRHAMRSALLNIVYCLIGGTPRGGNLSLVAKHKADGVMVGVFMDKPKLSRKMFDNARRIKSTAYQPISQLIHDKAAGLFVADSLFAVLDNDLSIHRSGGKTGIATIIKPSGQLSLV